MAYLVVTLSSHLLKWLCNANKKGRSVATFDVCIYLFLYVVSVLYNSFINFG